MISTHIIKTARAPIAAFAGMGVLWGTFAATLPDLQIMLGVDETRLGLLMFMTPIAAVAAMLIAPWIGATLGRSALPLSAVLMALAFVLPGQATAVWMFPVAMLCCGAGTGLTDVLMNARVAAMENKTGFHLMNLTHAAYSFGYAGAAVTAGMMRGAGWSPAMVLGSMAAVSLCFAFATWENDGAIDGLAKPKDAAAGRLGLVPLVGGGIVFIAFLTENAAENWSALHIERSLGGSPEGGAMGPAMIAMTMGIARIFGQGIADKVKPANLLMGGALISAIGALIAALATVPSMAYLGFVIMGLGSSVIAPTAFSLVGKLAEPQARARAVARATLLGYFGYFFGPPIVGVIAGSFGLRFAFVFAAMMLVAIPVLSYLMSRVSANLAKPRPETA